MLGESEVDLWAVGGGLFCLLKLVDGPVKKADGAELESFFDARLFVRPGSFRRDGYRF